MMAALVQSLPSPTTSTITMLQPRPSTADAFPGASAHQQRNAQQQQQRNVYTPAVPFTNYRGPTPVSPFAFHTTPVLQHGANPLRQHPTVVPRYDNRPAPGPNATTTRPRPPPVTAGTTPLNAPDEPKPLAALDANLPPTAMSYANVAKAAPDRYRRNNNRRVEPVNSGNAAPPAPVAGMPSGSGMAAVGHFYNHPHQTTSTPTLSTAPIYRGINPAATAPISVAPGYPGPGPTYKSQDDTILHSRQPSSESQKRYRRRSISSLEAKDFTPPVVEVAPPKPKTYAAMLASPAPTEAVPRLDKPIERRPVPVSSHIVDKKDYPKLERKEPERPASSNSRKESNDTRTTAPAAAKLAVPPRASSNETGKRVVPSPLAQQPTETPVPAPSSRGSDKDPYSYADIPQSPAAQQLAALNKKEEKKQGKSSRLRRAFSFGSAAELRKASAENSANKERGKLQKSQFADEEEAQQAAIAQQQEASGLGASIYSGQGHFFSGSTDNLSISSTASSASVMIRKMGKGMKKGTRSLAGLFRPKSIIGAPPPDTSAPEPTVAQVSMVTVEAEREKVNVNVNPHDQPGGGTGFPKLERNSLDATSIPQDTSAIEPRQSIVGGERERAEVLAAVKKGILKRTESGNSSPVVRPTPSFNLPQIPRVNDSPNSSAPSTPAEEATPRGKTDPVRIEGEEYFVSIQNYSTNGQSPSIPGTPLGNAMRNISFSPRIQFHDTWPSGEYDRRGEIATCNRLTPLLAQQIKEELNTFKMEMEVHAESKVYTHFF